MSAREPAIIVIGATGYTGSLVARELARAVGAEAVDVILAARDPERLGALAAETGLTDTAIVDVTDPDSLAAVIRRGDAVINTAGPFTELGEPVVEACIRAGAHYLDTTGEQPFMRAVRERHHEAAVEAGVAVVNAMAFEYALGDCAAAVAATGFPSPIDTLDVVYAWGGTASSVGTRRTALRMLGQRALFRRNGRLHRVPQAGGRRTVTLASGRTLNAVSFGAGEVLTAPRHLEIDTARGWLVMGRTASRLVPILAPALPVLMPVLRPVVEPMVTRKPDPTPAERESSRFTIRVELAGGGERRAHEVQGTDPYGLTAAIAILGAHRAMEPGAPAGVLAPAQLVDPRALFRALEPRGVRVVADPVTH